MTRSTAVHSSGVASVDHAGVSAGGRLERLEGEPRQVSE